MYSNMTEALQNVQIFVPEKIILKSSSGLKEILFSNTEPGEYIKLCHMIGCFSQPGVLLSGKYRD